jgi:hypothetical protein
MCIEDCRKGADAEAHIDSGPEGENPGTTLAFVSTGVPVGEIAACRDLEGAQDTDVEVAPRIMAKESAW